MLVHSIFESISGEAGGFPQGSWCTFIRLQGCNLRCDWCDTPMAQPIRPGPGHGTVFDVEELAHKCFIIRNKKVLITGGEPLVQAEGLIELIKLLREQGHFIQVETNGSLPVPVVDGLVYWVMDRKGPSSGMSGRMLSANDLNQRLRVHDNIVLKYVVTDHLDLQWAIEDMQKFSEYQPHFLLSPIDGKGEHISWMAGQLPMELRNRVVFSVQLHKLVGLD